MPENPTAAALDVRDLSVVFHSRHGDVTAVDGLTFSVEPGKVLGLVGESGSGKSATSLACLGLLPDYAQVSGQVMVAGRDMVSMPEKDRESMRGYEIAMIFQDALAALNPYRTVGRQIMDAYRLRHQVSTADAKKRAIEMLGLVGMTNPRAQVDMYPHEFSGGMRQRAMIAMSVVNEPRVLFADEPTTALDVTVQQQVLNLLNDLVDRLGMAMVLITHDLGVVAETADDVVVMYAGRAVEKGSVFDVFDHASHPYTVGLHHATPDMDNPPERLVAVPGVPASGTKRPPGCAFHPRCALQPQVGERCKVEVPLLTDRPGGPTHVAACHAQAAGIVVEELEEVGER